MNDARRKEIQRAIGEAKGILGSRNQISGIDRALLSGKCAPRTPNENYGFLFFICLILNS
jgi:hypothetical protein